ncbi:MAG TPA: hypothetical protein VHQ87_19040 [Rhizobacter sp.]|jgi:hypothetical protein|nr:hypothetical protein [Rhizobacter sp.]
MQARRLIQRAALLATATFLTSTAFAGNFTATYSAGLTTYNIQGTEPSDGAKHPVFIYTVGTTETWNNAQATAAVAEMAAKGFVAAAVQYDSSLFGTCSQILSKASYIYKGSTTSSAVAKLCARTTADCSKGILAAGFSQGSVIAINAKNYDSRVRAAYGMGAHNLYTAAYSLGSCMNNGGHTLAATNIRIVNGETDTFPGGTPSTVRSSSQSVTGKSCGSTAYSCLNTNGSGWIMVKGSQVGDGSADHCYQRAAGDCVGSENTLDNGWRNGADAWELKANLSWLAGFATP